MKRYPKTEMIKTSSSVIDARRDRGLGTLIFIVTVEIVEDRARTELPTMAALSKSAMSELIYCIRSYI